MDEVIAVGFKEPLRRACSCSWHSFAMGRARGRVLEGCTSCKREDGGLRSVLMKSGENSRAPHGGRVVDREGRVTDAEECLSTGRRWTSVTGWVERRHELRGRGGLEGAWEEGLLGGRQGKSRSLAKGRKAWRLRKKRRARSVLLHSS